MRDFRGEAEQEALQSAAYREWVSLRVRNIHDRVTPSDVLAKNGVHLKYSGHKPEQFSCPFHGKDNKPSTRYYPEELGKPAAVWCFVCQERWDSIGLFKKFEQLEGPFTRVLALMERAFGLSTPDMPREARRVLEPQENIDLRRLFEVCEHRLKGAKERFTLEGYLKVGSVLDRLAYQVRQGKQTPAVATQTLQSVLSKIGEKERAA